MPPIIEAFPFICMTLLFLNWLYEGGKESRARKERQRLQEWDRQKRERERKACEDWMARHEKLLANKHWSEEIKEQSRRDWYKRGKQMNWGRMPFD